jgi:hypothetical protein
VTRALVLATLLLSSHAWAGDGCSDPPFPDTDELRAWHQVMADLGPRPTASSAHRRWLRWLRKQLRGVPGVRLTIDRYPIALRQLERSASLTVVGADDSRRAIPVAGPVPYTRLTSGRGVAAPLVHLPGAQRITAAVAAGRIVVRERAIVGVPYGFLQQASHLWWDPGATLDPTARYERETLSRQTLDDVRAAVEAGAAGLVMIEPFPRAQVAGQYQPYRGEVFDVPALVLGADEGRVLLDAMEAGTSRGALAVRGTQRRRVTTWNIVATLPGSGPRTIVVASHTDGMNPIWDNGPVAMLALVRQLASLPSACRPTTFEFAFTSAHLHLTQHGADRYADGLLRAQANVPLVAVLEHLGATEFAAVARDDGGPGRVMVPTGAAELTFVFTSDDPPLLDLVGTRIVARNLSRVAVVPFSAGIANGEGRSYEERGFPTVAAIASPWTLRFPAFGMETVDVAAMREMTLALRDVILAVAEAP